MDPEVVKKYWTVSVAGKCVGDNAVSLIFFLKDKHVFSVSITKNYFEMKCQIVVMKEYIYQGCKGLRGRFN